jgi:hypothetical protein
VLAVFGGDTGVTEPLVGNDIGFYLCRLSAWSSLLSTAMFVTTLTAVGVALLYLLKGELALLPGAGKSTTRANWHVGGLAALFFVLLAVRLWVVTRASLAFSTTGPLVGASYTDVHASLPAIVVSALAALAAAGVALYAPRAANCCAPWCTPSSRMPPSGFSDAASSRWPCSGCWSPPPSSCARCRTSNATLTPRGARGALTAWRCATSRGMRR